MKTKIIIAIIAVIVVAGGVFAGLYFGTDIFKSKDAEQNTESTSKIANKIDEYLQKSEIFNNGKMKDFSKKLESSPYKNEGTISMKVSGISELSELNNLKLSFEGKVDPSSKNLEQNLAINYSGMSIDANLVKNKDVYGIQSDLFTGDDYIAVRNSNLKDLCRKLGADEDAISQIPDKIELGSLDKYIPSDEQVSKILDKYLNVISKGVEGLDSQKSGSVKTVEITQKDLYDIIIDILTTAKNDDELQSMIVDYADKYSEISEETYSISKSDIKSSIDEAIDEIKSMDTSEGNKIVVKLTYNSDNIVEKAEITVYSDGEEEMTIEFTSTDEIMEIVMSEGRDEITFSLEKDETDDSIEYDFSMSARMSGVSYNFANISLKYDGLGSNTVTQSMSMEIRVPAGYQTASISLNMTNEITFGNVDITTLSEDNAVILNDLSEDEIQEEVMDIYTRLNVY